MLSARVRIALFGAVCVCVVTAAIGYVLHTRSAQEAERRSAPSVARIGIATIDAGPRVVFRNTSLRSHYGDVAEVSLRDPRGPRAFTSTECDRVYAARSRLVCLSSDRGIATTYAAHVLNENMAATQRLPLTGIPSRARLSADAAYAATTSFTAGDSYAGSSFSTRTVITRVGGPTLGALEDFDLVHNGKHIKPIDRNYWGVTFASDGDTFYATVEWSNRTWLVRGSMSRRQIVTLHQDAECPSLSPDGRSIVYKQRGGLPVGKWRLVRYTIATGKVTPLTETRSVDDQVEWLDDDRVIYGLPRTGTQSAISDVWVVPADGTGHPSVFIPQAWSPAVVR